MVEMVIRGDRDGGGWPVNWLLLIVQAKER